MFAVNFSCFAKCDISVFCWGANTHTHSSMSVSKCVCKCCIRFSSPLNDEQSASDMNIMTNVRNVYYKWYKTQNLTLEEKNKEKFSAWKKWNISERNTSQAHFGFHICFLPKCYFLLSTVTGAHSVRLFHLSMSSEKRLSATLCSIIVVGIGVVLLMCERKHSRMDFKYIVFSFWDCHITIFSIGSL